MILFTLEHTKQVHRSERAIRALTDAIPFHAAFFLKLSRFGEPDI